MNNKLIYLILIFPFFMIGCNSSTESNLEVEQYYPMEIGNQWEYTSTGNRTVEKIIDTLTIHNKLFFGFTSGSEEPDYLLNESGGKIYYLNFNDSTEFLLFDFTCPIGNSWEIPSGYECSFGTGISLISKTETIETPMGTFNNCYHFRHQTVCRDAGMYDTWFVKGIGKVKYNFESFFGMQEYVIVNNNFITSGYR
jgi:hypothetical protein